MIGPAAEDPVWVEVSRSFGPRYGMRPKLSWTYGYSSRLAHDRVQRLFDSRAARRLRELVAPLDGAALSRLAALSQVNVEQARAGLRISLIANITAPVGVLALVKELAPGWIDLIGTSHERLALLLAAGSVVVMLLVGMWWAYGAFAGARDLQHLVHILLAERQVAEPSGSSLGGNDDELAGEAP